MGKPTLREALRAVYEFWEARPDLTPGWQLMSLVRAALAAADKPPTETSSEPDRGVEYVNPTDMQRDSLMHSGHSVAADKDSQPARDGLDVEALARALCAERDPTVPVDEEFAMFLDDECRSIARRVLARLTSSPENPAPLERPE